MEAFLDLTDYSTGRSLMIRKSAIVVLADGGGYTKIWLDGHEECSEAKDKLPEVVKALTPKQDTGIWPPSA